MSNYCNWCGELVNQLEFIEDPKGNVIWIGCKPCKEKRDNVKQGV